MDERSVRYSVHFDTWTIHGKRQSGTHRDWTDAWQLGEQFSDQGLHGLMLAHARYPLMASAPGITYGFRRSGVTYRVHQASE
ncbi:MAG: hypothetical protein E6Q97_12500 [Desulfurellales bacterium]|nr:MAG: hypothetical protein E6Q97_12500 [Desulfurellales bacterium]